MPATQWKPDPGLTDRLAHHPGYTDLFQPLRLLEQALDDSGRPGRIHFHNRHSPAFPPGPIGALSVRQGEDGCDIHITPAAIGLLGQGSTLPQHYTERLAAYERDTGDGGPSAFLDLLSDRALRLLYQAWSRQRPECEDGFMPLFLAICGAGGNPDVTGRHALAWYAAQIRSRTAPAEVMEGVLADYFGVPFKIEPLKGQWRTVPAQDRAQLGVAGVRLGRGVLLGERIFECGSVCGLRIGPLTAAQRDQFLRGTPTCQALAALLSQFAGAPRTFDVRLVLRAADVQGIRLAGGSRLGIDTVLRHGLGTSDRDDHHYLLEV